MANQQKVEFSQLELGHQFPQASYILETPMIEAYLEATEDTYPAYRQEELVPPTAVAAYAMAALAEDIELPPGTIHISQEIESLKPACVNDTITSHARVSGKRSRGKLDLLTIDIEVTNQNGEPVLAGKTTFLAPQQ